MSIEESKQFAKRLMTELQTSPILHTDLKFPKKHLDRIAGAAETVFMFNNVPDEQSLIDAVINEDGRDAENFQEYAGFDELQLAVNKYRNSL